MKSRHVAISILLASLLFTGCAGKKSNTSDIEKEAQIEVVEEETVSPVEETPDDEENEIFNKIVAELKQYIEDQNFDTWLSVYEEYKEMYPALSDRLEEKKAEHIAQISKVLDDWLIEADDLMVSGDRDGANIKLEDVVEIAANFIDINEICSYVNIAGDRRSYYFAYLKELESFDLMNTEPFDMDDGCFFRDESGRGDSNYDNYYFYNDRFGNTYKKFYLLQVTQTNEHGDKPYVIFYNSDNKYDRFSASYVSHNEMKEDKVFHIEVYGDDTLLYTSDPFTSYEEPMSIDLDITGYKMIKFMAIREDHYLSVASAQPSVGLYEANFYHSIPPEFEYYTPQ